MNGEAIRFLRLEGTPFERGVQHGREIPDILAGFWVDLVRDVRDRVDRPIAEDELRAWLRDRAELARSVEPDLMEEIRGIAEGGGVEEEVAVAIAFAEEVGQLAYSLGYHHEVVRGTRCLAVVVPPSRTSSAGYLLAQTWDGPDWCPDPFLFAPKDPPGWSAYLADPGSVGGVGVNDRRIGSVHTGVLVRENPVGNPYSFIARRIMLADRADDAATSVSEVASTAGCHYIVVQDDAVIDVEAAGAVFETVPHEGLFSTCAHFAGGSTAALHAKPEHGVSRHRTSRLAEIVAEESEVTPLGLMELLTDHREGPDGSSVCLHASDRTGRSLGAIVIDVAGATIWGRAGNPCEHRPIREVRLTDQGPRQRVLAEASVDA
jgi:isopenicillin-N N-acyltransferase-like protein